MIFVMMADAPKILYKQMPHMKCHSPIINTGRHNIAEYGNAYNTTTTKVALFDGAIQHRFQHTSNDKL